MTYRATHVFLALSGFSLGALAFVVSGPTGVASLAVALVAMFCLKRDD